MIKEYKSGKEKRNKKGSVKMKSHENRDLGYDTPTTVQTVGKVSVL